MMTVAEFRVFAIAEHKKAGKLYDGQPYEVHLDMVAGKIKKYSRYIPGGINGLAPIEMAAYGHDLIEDCGLTYNDIKKVAGENVARIILNVSDVPGEDRTERFLLTCVKTRRDASAIYLKICDRMANTEYSIQNGSSMSKKYQKEYAMFKYVYEPKSKSLAAMWKDLDEVNGL